MSEIHAVAVDARGQEAIKAAADALLDAAYRHMLSGVTPTEAYQAAVSMTVQALIIQSIARVSTEEGAGSGLRAVGLGIGSALSDIPRENLGFVLGLIRGGIADGRVSSRDADRPLDS